MELRILVVLLIVSLFVIHGEKIARIFVNEVAVLDKYAENGTKIADNALILTENGFLGEGAAGFVYAGRLKKNERPVAIKFFAERKSAAAKTEYEILKHMQADTDPEIENFGIPALHYYGEWNHFILIATTKLDESLNDIEIRRTISPLEMMTLLKNFVIQSRYMHTHGVHHGDIHPKNIMFSSNQSFIIDFDRAKIMENKNVHFLTHDDWKDFIFTMLELYKIRVPDNWHKFKRRLRKKISDKELLSVVIKFGDEAFSTDHSEPFPKYDEVEKFINGTIKNHGGGTGS